MKKLTRQRIGTIFPIVLVASILLGYGGNYLAGRQARSTYLKSFYEHVAEAEQDSNDLPFSHQLDQGSVSGSDGGGRTAIGVADCKAVTVYKDGGNTTYGALSCLKGFYKSYGLDGYSRQQFDTINSVMIAHGWQLDDGSDYNDILLRIESRTESSGFSYHTVDGLMAEVTFVPHNAPWHCQEDRLCSLSHASVAQAYQGIVDVLIQYESLPL